MQQPDRLNLRGTQPQAAAGTRLGRHCSCPGAFLPLPAALGLDCSVQHIPPLTPFTCLTPSYQPQLPLATQQSGAPQQGHRSTAACVHSCVAVPGLSQLHYVTVCDKESSASMKRKGRQRGDNTEQLQVGCASDSDSLLYFPADHCVISPREDFRKAGKISILHSPKATFTLLGRGSRFGLHLLSPSPLSH